VICSGVRSRDFAANLGGTGLNTNSRGKGLFADNPIWQDEANQAAAPMVSLLDEQCQNR